MTGDVGSPLNILTLVACTAGNTLKLADALWAGRFRRPLSDQYILAFCDTRKGTMETFEPASVKNMVNWRWRDNMKADQLAKLKAELSGYFDPGPVSARRSYAGLRVKRSGVLTLCVRAACTCRWTPRA